ncbi:MAG TPA: contractile injection system tape measure protein, partial [Saprospiraceae bacterium]|nr:contractile injection system tape measure protein [Saprospiraceae bacterium]
AIDNWGALGSTSPDGLRGNFLVRDGKLTRTDLGRLLQVEAQSYDLLLDRLPWGINMVKLPWMEDMLFVEWR